MGRISQYLIKEWDKDPVNLVSIIMLFTMAIVNAIASQIPDANNYFQTNNIYQTSVWAASFFVLYQLVQIAKAVNREKATNAGFAHVSDIYDVIHKYRIADSMRIYCGSESRETWGNIANTEGVKFKNITLFTRPNKAVDIDEPQFTYDSYDVHLADIPKNYLFLIGHHNDGACVLCDLVVADESRGGYLCADLSHNEEHAKAFSTLFESSCKHSSVALRDYLAFGIFNFISKKHIHDQDSLLRQRKVSLRSRVDFFELATELVKVSRHSLQAVDFFKPNHWLNDISARKYGEAHGVEAGTKERVHVYNLDEAKRLANEYDEFVRLMDSKGVTLYFLNENLFDTNLYEKRGSLIIDENCVIVAINPSQGASFGEVDFNPLMVEDYGKRFRDLKDISQSAQEFLKLIGGNP
ncbi:MAG: hypothetical protein AB2697_06865 [Candidatus Thiodiazotropha endolucinida]